MGSFEKEIRQRMFLRTLYAVCMGIIVSVAFILKAFVFGSIKTLDSWDIGILIGLFLGAEISSSLRIAQFHKALKNPEILEALHIEERDERNRMIALKAGQTGMSLTLLLLALSAIVMSFINKTVFLTIDIIFVSLLGLYFLLAKYYSRKI